MESYLTFETKNKNSYIYNSIHKIISHNHPILEFLINYYAQTRSLNFPKYKDFEKLKFTNYKKEDYDYYIKKVLFFYKTDFLKETNTKLNYNGKINKNTILTNLANLKQLTFEVTERCNLDCVYCGYGKLYSNNKKRERQDLSFEKAKIIIDEVIRLKMSKRSLSSVHKMYISFYGGEPLLNMDFIIRVVEYIKNIKNIPFKPQFSITTNGVFLNKYINFLIENSFNILVSLDGNKKNNGFRIAKDGKDRFNTITRNINYIKTNYKIFYKNNISFNSVLHSKNSVEDIQSFFTSEYDKMPSIAELNTNGVNSDCQNEFANTYNSFEESYNKSKKKKIIDKSLSYRHPRILNINSFIYSSLNFAYFDYNDLIYKKDKKQMVPTGTCQPFSKKMFVTASGSILPCEKIGTKSFYGSVNESSIIFDYKAFVNNFNSNLNKIKPKCKVCYFSDNCSKCIYYIDNSVNCDFFMTKKRFAEYLSNTYSDIETSEISYDKILNDLTIDL